MDSETGFLLSRPVAEEPWLVLTTATGIVEAPNGEPAIAWDVRDSVRTAQEAPLFDDQGVLDQFVRLADGSSEDVVTFVRTYGVLDLCRHGHVVPHRRRSGRHCRNRANPQLVSHYQWYARAVRAALLLAAAAHRNRPGSEEDWRILSDLIGSVPPKPTAAAIPGVIQDVVGWWLFHGEIRPVFRWRAKENASVQLRGRGLLGAIARQLLFTVARVEGLSPRLSFFRQWSNSCRSLGRPSSRFPDQLVAEHPTARWASTRCSIPFNCSDP